MTLFDAMRRAYILLARDDKPTAAAENRGMVLIERGAPDYLRYSRIGADGSTNEWATPRVSGEKVAAADIDASAITSGRILKVVAGALTGIAPTTPQFGWGVKDHTAVNVTSTSGASVSQLQASVTLASGYVWDLFFWGSVAANAPSGDFIYVGATINSGAVASFGWTDTGTAGGERALGFGGFQQGITGDDASHACFCRAKVGSGTGTLNSGWCMAVALPRLP